MNRSTAIVTAIVFILCAAMPATAGDSLIQSVVKGCQKELETYCKDVTPGQGRGLACLYAHDDKLSSQCEYALYDAAVRLERAVAALSYVANECRDDLRSHCKDVRPGEGRLLDCMEKNQSKLSARCKQAIKQVAPQ